MSAVRQIVIVRLDLDTVGVIECDSGETARALAARLEAGLTADDYSVEVMPLEAETATAANIDEIVKWATSDD